jgi:hydroxylaminobenzene mutase
VSGTEPVEGADTVETQRRLAMAAAVLFLLGGLTGGYISAAQSGQIDADVGHAIAAHLNALLGTFWMLGVAWSLRFSTLGPRGLRALFWLLVSAAYGNWLLTGIKAALHVHGTYLSGDAKNDAMLGALTAVVVLPSLAATVLWIAGLRRPKGA